MGVVAETGELFINPLSERGVREPLTVTLHLPPPDTNDIQALPMKLKCFVSVNQSSKVK